jgi:ankyrin repeat protein
LQTTGCGDDLKESGESTTPLYWTVFRQDLKAVELLLSHNADPNQLDSFGDPLVAFAAAYFPRGATSNLILVVLLRRGVEDKHLHWILNHPKVTFPPAVRAVLQKVINAQPAWCEVCSAIMNIKICKCVSVAY